MCTALTQEEITWRARMNKGTESSGSMKRGAFDQHSNYQILKDCILHNCAGQNIGYIAERCIVKERVTASLKAGLPDSLSGRKDWENHEIYQKNLCPGQNSNKGLSDTVVRYIRLH